jgi:hypothetical protein
MMRAIKVIGYVVLTLVLTSATIDFGTSTNRISISLVSKAEAVVGRPLTPVSYAGVARRTARRCASGVYNC